MNLQKLAALSLCFGITLTGCGGSGDSGGGEVSSITLEQSIIPVGGATVAEADFSYDAGNIFGSDARVVLHFLLPPGVTYRSGSAEIDTVGGNDISASAQVDNCSASGETLVTFDFDSEDLLGALNPGGNADATLTFTVDGTATTQAVIQGRGDEDVNSAVCGQPFAPDSTASITVQ